jgi:hypothetical protein
MFSNESCFLLHRHGGGQRVYHCRGERFVDACVTQVDLLGGGAVMVWLLHDTDVSPSWCSAMVE